eukprot:1128012_1
MMYGFVKLLCSCLILKILFRNMASCCTKQRVWYWCGLCVIFCSLILYVGYIHSSLVLSLVETRVAKSIQDTTALANRNVTILIGVSPNKCGSSYFHYALESTFDALHYHALHNTHSEVKYWDRCIARSCDMQQYLHAFVDNITQDLNTTQYKYKTIILFEKSPLLIRMYHSAYLLAHYAQSYSIYLYGSLRNPADRTWSQYWMDYGWMFNKTKSEDIHKMIDKISSDYDSFAYKSPKYQKVIDFIRITNASQMHNDDVDEAELVELYIHASYDLFNNLDYMVNRQIIDRAMDGEYSPLKTPPPMISCYYPQVVMYYRIFNSFNMAHRLKFFQMEFFINNIDQVIKELLTWISGNNNRKINDIANYFDIGREQSYSHANGHRSSFVPKTIQLKDTKLYSKLNAFYGDCNLRLHWFFEQHPELKLLPHIPIQFLDS